MTATVALYFAAVYANDTWLNPYDEEYETLRHLGAGMSASHFEATLGPPSISNETTLSLGGDRDTGRSLTYIKDDFLVEVLATSDGNTVMYSVLTCNESFQPIFDAPMGSTVSLGSSTFETTDKDANLPTIISYDDLATEGSPIVYQETKNADAPGVNGHAYGYGFNALCKPGNELLKVGEQTLPAYSGPAEGAPVEIGQFRTVTRPNFYIETAGGWPLLEDNLTGLGTAKVELPAWFFADRRESP